MITIRRINTSDVYDLITCAEIDISLEKQYNGNNRIEFFIVTDGKRLLGHASAILFSSISTAQINEIYILPEERNNGLGDALLRAVFHYLRINSCVWAIIKSHTNLDKFLINRGIEQIDYSKSSYQIKSHFGKEDLHEYHICNIEEFFKEKCKGSQ
ncbi:GNAT family N-acetyltransferase [Alkaliphilus sp. B6464]|uniref:GNAT family N-acetyltransferase n=1 Tax=Alkaliphilus sp. B6464 TaxID=2731219 RepID=UPI001BA7B873|nr:GNAT family N-acetyltransferase [Alkaliphilus sp. B6464]QUH20737.1 GNAT family N-acetyltransferase [Alkaliphilus sp. B6464]